MRSARNAVPVDTDPAAPFLDPGLPGDVAAMTLTFERLYEVLRRLTPDDGMSLTASSTLRRLQRFGPHRLSDLAVAERITQPAMTQLVSRLEREGLAERRGDPGDGRVVLVHITPDGEHQVRSRRTVRARRLGELLAQLPAEDRDAVLAARPGLDRLAALPTRTP
jgi:DNA-binding MarR family transcriptional regulator